MKPKVSQPCYDGCMVEDLRAARAAALGAEAADEDLIVAVGQGDHSAYGHMIDRHLNRTVALAQRVVGNRGEAEEIAQEAFLRLWRHAGKWRPQEERGARFTTWFYRVVMNLCLDLKRKPRSASLELVEDPVDPSLNALAKVQQEQTAAQAPNIMFKMTKARNWFKFLQSRRW